MASVVVAAGGTGGHVYPALATAEVLRARGHDVAFAGGDRVEARLVPEAGFPLRILPARGLPRGVRPAAVGAGWALVRSVAGARRLLREVRADVVLGMGGYPSLAPCVAAGFAAVPVVLHEQNAVLSLANRLSLRWTRALALSVPLVPGPPRRSGLAVALTGNPIRASVATLAVEEPAASAARRIRARASLGMDADMLTVLVFGGSQGARAINEAMPACGPALPEGVQVLHVTGPGNDGAVREAWQATGRRVVVRPYLDAMQDAYAASDVVVCRAGMSTLAEITALGIPAVVVPLPTATANHQEANARYFASLGAALRVRQDEPGFVSRLASAVVRVAGDDDARAEMAAASRAAGRPRAADDLAALVEDALRGPRSVR